MPRNTIRWHGDVMSMTYKVIINAGELAEIYRRLKEEKLLWAVWSDIDDEEWTESLFVKFLSRDDTLVLGGYIDGELAGVMTMRPAEMKSLTANIGLTAFRKFFKQAVPLCMGALLWACDTQDMKSILGRVAAPNRHILRLLSSLGFKEIGRVPGMTWYTRKQAFVDGVLVLATVESIRAAAAELEAI